MKKEILIALAVGLLGALIVLAIVVYMPNLFLN
jgi:hypothetical protein